MPEAGFLDDVVFPVGVSKGSTGGPDRPVAVVELGSGHEERNAAWSAPLRRYDARWGVRTREELYEILRLHLVARGPLYGFRLMDWTDHRSGSPAATPTPLDQGLGTGDGTATVFPLAKTHAFAGRTHARRIHKPVAGSVSVAVDGVPQASGWALDAAAGTVGFDAPPAPGAVLGWGGEFHVPVRFDGPLDQTALRGPIGDIPSIPLKELRL